MPLMPAPPMPMKCTGPAGGSCTSAAHASTALQSSAPRSSSPGRSPTLARSTGESAGVSCYASTRAISSATAAVAAGRPSARLAAAIRASRSGSPSSACDLARQARSVELLVGDDDGPAAGGHPLGVPALMVGAGEGVGYQNRRPTESGDLGQRASGARDDEVGGGHEVGELVGVADRREERTVDVAAARDPPLRRRGSSPPSPARAESRAAPARRPRDRRG